MHCTPTTIAHHHRWLSSIYQVNTNLPCQDLWAIYNKPMCNLENCSACTSLFKVQSCIACKAFLSGSTCLCTNFVHLSLWATMSLMGIDCCKASQSQQVSTNKLAQSFLHERRIASNLASAICLKTWCCMQALGNGDHENHFQQPQPGFNYASEAILDTH